MTTTIFFNLITTITVHLLTNKPWLFNYSSKCKLQSAVGAWKD